MRDAQDETMLRAMDAHLTPEGSDALRTLASTAVALNASSAHPQVLAHAFVACTSTSQTLTNNLSHVQVLHDYLDKQHALLRTQLNQLQSNPAFAAPPSLPRQTTEQTRQTKHLRTKIREHDDRLASLQASQGRNAATPASKTVASAEAIAGMLEQQAALDALGSEVEGLEKRVSEYAHLPADKEAARRELAKLEVELDKVRRRRDALFEGLVVR